MSENISELSETGPVVLEATADDLLAAVEALIRCGDLGPDRHTRALREASSAMTAAGKPPRCLCPDDSGDCDWCQAYYGAESWKPRIAH